MMNRQTHGQTDARGKTICLPTLARGDIIKMSQKVFYSIFFLLGRKYFLCCPIGKYKYTVGVVLISLLPIQAWDLPSETSSYWC